MSKLKVLIVDDEPDIIRTVRIRLESEGYEIYAATDASEAMKIALKELPNLIILDIMMPGANGHQIAGYLRNSIKTCDIPIIYLTASSSDADYQEAIGLSVTKYITKPFDPDELVVEIEGLLLSVKKEMLL